MKRSEPLAPLKLRQRLDAYMVKKGLRSSEQRRATIDTFFATNTHVSMEDLLAQVRLNAAVGPSTVHRMLKVMVEAGVARAHRFGDGVTRYELVDGDTQHDHLVCTQCGEIAEFEEPRIEALQLAVARRLGFVIEAHKHELYGVCARCQPARTVS